MATGASIRVGTASWTDKTLLESGWYPRRRTRPEKRLALLRHASFRWSRWTRPTTPRRPSRPPRCGPQRTPAGFTFNIKAFSLLTGHPTKVSAIYKDLRPETDKKNVYPDDLAPDAYEEVWERFLSALDPLVEAGQARRAAVPVPALVHHPPVQQAVPARGREAVQPAAGRRSSCATSPGSTATTRTRRWSSCATPPALRLRGHAAGPQVVDPAGRWRPPPTWPWSASTATATSGRARTSTRSSATTTRERS